MTDLALAADAPIGIFDSGVGGLSVLRHIRAQLPHEHLLYFADTGYAPYGDKPEQVVLERSLAIADFLFQRGAKALVVACNTATVAAIAILRARHPSVPIVGVEPGLKPAAALTRSGKVGVLATDTTLAGQKFLRLREQISRATSVDFLLQGCSGLADQIELGELHTEATLALLRSYILPLLNQGVDTLVLGCTHYPFVLAEIERIVASNSARAVTLVDTGEAVARQLARLLSAGNLVRAATDQPARLEGYTSAGQAALSKAFSTLLGLNPAVSEIRLAPKTENLEQQRI